MLDHKLPQQTPELVAALPDGGVVIAQALLSSGRAAVIERAQFHAAAPGAELG